MREYRTQSEPLEIVYLGEKKNHAFPPDMLEQNSPSTVAVIENIKWFLSTVVCVQTEIAQPSLYSTVITCRVM